jgi:hypothetical protein
MNPVLDIAVLERQNKRFAGTGGRSEENRPCGFKPAFMDTATRLVYTSRFADGTPAPVHLLDGLPPELVIERNVQGRAIAVKATVIAGFVRDGHFYTRAEAGRCLAEQHDD